MDEIDFLVEQVMAYEGAFGARLSGGGFGGAAVALVRPDYAERIGETVKSAYKKQFGIDAEIYVARPWQGTELIEL